MLNPVGTSYYLTGTSKRTNWFQMDILTGSSVPPFAVSSHNCQKAMVKETCSLQSEDSYEDLGLQLEERHGDMSMICVALLDATSCRAQRKLNYFLFILCTCLYTIYFHFLYRRHIESRKYECKEQFCSS